MSSTMTLLKIILESKRPIKICIFGIAKNMCICLKYAPMLSAKFFMSYFTCFSNKKLLDIRDSRIIIQVSIWSVKPSHFKPQKIFVKSQMKKFHQMYRYRGFNRDNLTFKNVLQNWFFQAPPIFDEHNSNFPNSDNSNCFYGWINSGKCCTGHFFKHLDFGQIVKYLYDFADENILLSNDFTKSMKFESNSIVLHDFSKGIRYIIVQYKRSRIWGPEQKSVFECQCFKVCNKKWRVPSSGFEPMVMRRQFTVSST